VLLAVSLGVNSLIAYIESSYVQAFELASPNMQPTLLVGDHVLVNRRSSPGDLRRGDLIIHGYGKDSNRDYVERVVAIGGDNVEIRDEVLFVNDIPQNEPFVLHSDKGIIPKQDGPRDSFGPIIVPPHSYFVLGDNRDYGSDSLSWNVVDKRLVKGKIRTIYFSWDEENGAVRWERIGLQFQRRNDKPKS
jgi:signal peptidase I